MKMPEITGNILLEIHWKKNKEEENAPPYFFFFFFSCKSRKFSLSFQLAAKSKTAIVS